MKRILATVLALAVVLTVTFSSTIAYLTDTESTINVAEMGNVDIELLEYERVVDENGKWVPTGEEDQYGYTPDKVQEFSQIKPLYPAVFANAHGTTMWDDRNGSQNASGDGSHQQSWGQIVSKAGNPTPGSNQLFDDSMLGVLDKFVFVENTGTSEAYVRVWFAFEQGDMETATLSDGGFLTKTIQTNRNGGHWKWNRAVAQNVEIDGNNYVLWTADYVGPNQDGKVIPGEVTRPSLLQVYMEPSATNEDVKTIDGNGNNGYDILVFAQAVQVANFEDITDQTILNGKTTAEYALNAAFNGGGNNAPSAKNHPWIDMEINVDSIVNDAEGLAAALKKGGNIYVNKDIVTEETLEVPEGVTANLNMNGKKLSGAVAGGLLINKGTLTLKDAVLDSTASEANAVHNHGTMTMEGGSFSSVGAYTVSNKSGAKLTINGAAVNNGINNSGELLVNSGTVKTTSGVNYAIEHNGTSLTIMEGTFESNNYEVIQSNNHPAEIYGGTFNKVEKAGYLLSGSKMTIYGGTFNAYDAIAEKYEVRDNVTVMGGTFNYNHTTVASGYMTVDNGNGTWTVQEKTVVVTTPTDKNDKVSNGNNLLAAINQAEDGEPTIISVPAGTYKMPGIDGSKNVTITGGTDTVIDNTLGSYQERSTISFEGVTIKGSTGKANGNGSDYAALYSPNVTYTNCTFDGPFRIGRDGAKFINCTFTNLGNDYVWNYGNDCTFENCTFETEGKALLLYSDGGTEIANVVVKDCVFNATKGATAGAITNQNCAAIEIHNYGHGANLITSGNTINSNFSGEWRIKTYESGRTNVYVNGVEYTQTALDGKLMTVTGGIATLDD